VKAAPTLADYAGLHVQRRGEAAARSEPSVSIVTIVRNGAATLRRAAESVLSQDHPGIEYIIVDGGSTDGTLDIIRALEDRVAWISGKDAGISDAFNKGVALARGEVIGIINSDDWYEPGAIGKAARRLQQAGADVACGPMQYWAGAERSWRVSSDPLGLERTMTIGHPTVFARRELYRRIGLFRPEFRLAMDYEWLLRAKCAGARFAVVDDCLANMSEGGFGDRRWYVSQIEVAKARAMHLPGSRARIAADLAIELARGFARRLADRLGLQPLRRWYHERRR
jgi:glycosyltransferase involved in cell wall biosynthesis